MKILKVFFVNSTNIKYFTINNIVYLIQIFREVFIMLNLFQGQTLWCKNCEKVLIKDIKQYDIIVEYNGKSYVRHIDTIGKTLFTHNTIHSAPQKSTSYTCNNCMLSRQGECFPKKEICGYFKCVPNIDKKTTEHWPKCGDATAAKFGNYYR